MTKTQKYLIAFVFFALVVGLFFLGWYINPGRKDRELWAANGIKCLSNGHENLALHIHPTLQIIIDGKLEAVPANIGIIPTCMAEVHTHDASGKVHIETSDADKKVTLGQFFAVWGIPLEKDGYTIKVTVDEKPVDQVSDLILVDNQKIILEYTSK